MINYNPANWYWFVAGDQTQVYSSASGDFVQPNDATYTAWLAAGGSPSNADSMAGLGATLAPLLLRPVNASVLGGYQNFHAQNIVGQAIFRVLFSMKNDILTLQGKPTITAAQALAAVKALM